VLTVRCCTRTERPDVPVDDQTDVKQAEDEIETECSAEQRSPLVSVVVDVLPSPRHDGPSTEDEIPSVNPSPTPQVVIPSDVDNGEPEIEAEFRQNLSHLRESGECTDDDEQNGGVRLSRIVEDNLDLGLELVGEVSRLY